MSNIDNVQFVDQAQLKQVMLANADKADKRYAKKSDVAGFVKAEDLGTLASKNVIGSDDLDPALAGVIDGKADAAGLYTAEETDAQIEAAIGELGALASQDTVAEDDLADGLKNKINDVYTKSEVYTKEDVYTKDETDAAITARVSTVYKPAGTINATMIPEPNANILGYVYNLAEDITTTEAFVEGAGKVVKAGTNIVVVEVAEDTYKLDAFAGTIDLSDYVKFEDINVASSAQINSIIDSIYAGSDINDDPEVVDVVLTSTTSLREVATFFADPAVETVNAKLNDDITVPDRDDGKISTTLIPEGKTLNLDLNGHNIDCVAYALYNKGTVELTDSTGEATITTRLVNNTYPAIQNEGNLIIDGVNIDTTQGEIGEGEHNWTYGVVNANNATVEIRSGHIKTGEAACLSICNGTASSEGTSFIVGGDTVLETTDSAAIYLADNKNLIIKDDAIVDGGIIARMGNIVIEDNAQVINNVETSIDDYGEYYVSSGTIQSVEGILLLTGVYKTNAGTNDLTVTVKDNATLSAANADVVKVCMLDYVQGADQTVSVNIEDSSKVTVPEGYQLWNVLDHDACAAISEASGKTMKAKVSSTALTIKVDGETVFSNVDSGTI